MRLHGNVHAFECVYVCGVGIVHMFVLQCAGIVRMCVAVCRNCAHVCVVGCRNCVVYDFKQMTSTNDSLGGG